MSLRAKAKQLHIDVIARRGEIPLLCSEQAWQSHKRRVCIKSVIASEAWQSQYVSLRAKRGNLIKTNVFLPYRIAALLLVARNDKKRNQSYFLLRDCRAVFAKTPKG
jgi:hypothetical protein